MWRFVLKFRLIYDEKKNDVKFNGFFFFCKTKSIKINSNVVVDKKTVATFESQ